MVPTKDRNHFSVFLDYSKEGILIDCGEGTQRQFRKKGIPVTKIKKILITHWHGDHVLGLMGIIQSMGANNYKDTLEIYSIKGSKKYFQSMLKSVSLRNIIDIKFTEINEGMFFENEKFKLESKKVKHGIECLAYKFTEKDKRNINLNYTKKFGLTQHPLLGKLQKGKDIVYQGKKITVSKGTKLKKGKKITFILDTEYFKGLEKFAKESDILVIESTLLEKDKKEGHLTAKLAGKIAKNSKVKELILTHFSQRYRNTKEIEKEVKKEFKKVKISKDLMEIKV